MSIRKIGLSLIPAAMVMAATLQSGSAFAAEQCLFDKYTPISAAPLKGTQSNGYDTYTYTKGAQLFIPAQPGLTREWLTRTVQTALANDQACSPTVQPTQVAVSSAGSGFWLQLSSKDEKDAKALLSWANSLVEQKYAEHYVPAAAGAQ